MDSWQLDKVKGQSSPPSLKSLSKRSVQACDYCKSKKVKCNGGTPCTQCLDRGKKCVRNLKSRHEVAKGKKKELPRQQQQALWSATPATRASIAPRNNHDARTIEHYQESKSLFPYLETSRSLRSRHSITTLDPNHYEHTEAYQQAAEDTEQRVTGPSASDNYDSPENNTVCPAEISHSEYHGPRSFFSIFSKPGIAWVTNQTHTAGFQEVAHHFMQDVTRKLKLEGMIPRTRTKEPEPELAWKCVEAYFEEAQEAAFGVVHRTWFESRLRAHFKGADTTEDNAWYALRNVVFAYGHRSVFPDQFALGTKCGSSWSWFENALSVHSELIFARTSLVGVQALTVMAYYTEGLPGIHIQYMLAATAIHLACSKGLHRQPAPSWAMTTEMIQQRSRIFWAIYCLEKAILGRTGRPSAIDDNEITCHAPNASSPKEYPNPTYCSLLVQICQMTSVVVKTLNSAQGLKESPEETLQTIMKLDSQLKSFKVSIEHIIDLDSLIDPTKLSPLFTLRQALDLQFAYFSTVFNLHSSLANPWSVPSLRRKADPKLQDKIKRCSSTAAAAAKTAILSTNLVRVDATSQVAHAYYIPVFAMITLFIHTIQYLTDPKMTSDLILLDLAVGHFARLQITAGFELRFARELNQFATRVMEGKPTQFDLTASDKSWLNTLQTEPVDMPLNVNDAISGPLEDSDTINYSQAVENLFGFAGNLNDMWDMDMWSTLLEDSGTPYR